MAPSQPKDTAPPTPEEARAERDPLDDKLLAEAAPVTAKDTPSPAMRKLALEWLDEQERCDKDTHDLFDRMLLSHEAIPDEWVDALASELDAAISERLQEWLSTLKEGRAPTQYVVEWEHRDLDKRPQDVAEMLAEQADGQEELDGLGEVAGVLTEAGAERRKMGEEAYRQARQAGQAIGYTGCHDDHADCIPADEAPEAVEPPHRWG